LQTGRIVVTGGAGFVGSAIASALAQRNPAAEIVAFDRAPATAAGFTTVQADLANKDAVMALGPIDALVECSADPDAEDVTPMGTYHCLELARRYDAQVIYLSTSRVYPLRHLRAIEVIETETRFEIAEHQELPGVSPAGISEEFPLWGLRTQYGAAKLSAEQLIEDYVGGYELRAVVNRLGAIGPSPGLLGEWARAKQVRDLLHVDDVVELVAEQLAAPDDWAGEVLNVGGGRANSLSLVDAGIMDVEAGGDNDFPVYISDCTRLFARSSWRPRRDARAILEEAATRRRERG
jgi:CDP-paratose 2-epimerase